MTILNDKFDMPSHDRIEQLAREAGHERALYVGEAIGTGLVNAWNALQSVGAWLTRSAPRQHRLN